MTTNTLNEIHDDIDLTEELFNSYIIKLNELFKTIKPLKVRNCTFYVGDVHGSFQQALLPLILAGIIEHVEVTPERIEYIPKNSTNKVVYLGDMFHRNLFSNELL